MHPEREFSDDDIKRRFKVYYGDGDRSLFPSQVFFPMAGAKDGRSKLARNLKAEIDEEKIEAFKGTLSLPFEKSDNAKIAVKIVDDRGIESLRVISL
jgi:adenine-specific DNA-methyltransferase